ncbi:MAG: ABC transporter substrate-binding protein [Patescibacteria group bacterium]
MIQTHKNLIFGLVIVVLVVLGFAVTRRETSREVVLGGLFNLTGYGAFAGESSRDGFTMAFEDANLPKTFVKPAVEDAASDLKMAVSGATKLITVDNAITVIGPEWTEFGEVVAPIAVKNKVPFISPWMMAEAPFVQLPYYWSATPSDRSEHTALVKYFAEHGLKKVDLIYSKNFWSQTNIAMLKEEMQKVGGLQIIAEHSLDQSARDFRTIISQIKAEKPDVIYAAIAEDDGHGAFVSQARQLGVTTLIAAHSARVASPVMKEKYKAVMYDQLFGEQVAASRSREFEIKYEKRFEKQVQAPSAAAAYDMTTIVLAAIKSGARTSEDIVTYLKTMSAYEGYSGMIKFDERGQLPLREVVVKKYNREGIAEEVK